MKPLYLLPLLVLGSVIIMSPVYYGYWKLDKTTNPPLSSRPTIIMMGDSHIEMGDWQSLTRCPVVKISHGGATTTEVVKTMLPQVKADRPTVGYVMAGLNDIYQKVSTTETVANLKKLSDAGFKVFPVMPTVVRRDDYQNIWELNRVLIHTIPLLPPVQVYEYGEEKYNTLNPYYAMEDGMHLNNKGRRVWYKQMKAEFKKVGC